MSYDHKSIDGKWQKRWLETGVFNAKNGDSRKKFFVLVEFPYPSGAGLHVGHPRSYTALDIIARKRRMEGLNVLFPMGWDAFGLPAENYAIKTGIHPAITTKENIDTFRRQLQSLGFSFDWSREFSTTDPSYYKWTQWMFLQFFKAGLAYKAKSTINWCPKDKCGLANEEVVAGACERCGTPVEKREKEQWMIAITKYADRLIEDLKDLDYLPKIKKQQEEWIGRSEGAEVDFVLDGGEKVTVFTTRVDTIFGATYLVLAPEHPLVLSIATSDQRSAVDAYIAEAGKKTDIDRGDDTKEKTGVFTGAYATNPANSEKIPVWIADYVLPHYGTGAIMAVPAHDERDHAFAKKFELPIRQVISPLFRKDGDSVDAVRPELPFVERNAAVCVVKHWSEEKYLISLYKASGWRGFVIGGIEAGEKPEAAGAREIVEETGYENVHFVHPLGDVVNAQFYHAVKNVNRWAKFQGLLFELTDGARHEIEKEEKDLADLEWVSKEKVMEFLTAPDIKCIWNRVLNPETCSTEKGILIDSGSFTGMSSDEAIDGILKQIGGRKKTTYKLRDWVFSRQRYWGEPIPLVHCEKDGWVAVPDSQLPVELPNVEKYEPTDSGESPLAHIDSFVSTTCPTCGGPAERETDTMPNWAGSSWYFLRYADAHNDQEFASMDALKYWMPVDIYNGGMEHTTLHLLYSRFWNKFLFDQGLVPTSEPYQRRHSHGLILAEDGRKMSKSWGNVVNPDDVVQEHGADTLRLYEVFMGPFEEPVPWSTNGVIGVKRFLDKVVRLSEKVANAEDIAVTKALHKTIDKVSKDIEAFRFNTAVAQCMMFVNAVQEKGAITKESLAQFLRVLVPFAPHVANELWEKLGFEGFVEEQAWPVAEEAMLKDDEVELGVQVNGKLRASITVSANATDEEVVAKARAEENVAKYLEGEPKKVIVVKGRLVSFVV